MMTGKVLVTRSPAKRFLLPVWKMSGAGMPGNGSFQKGKERFAGLFFVWQAERLPRLKYQHIHKHITGPSCNRVKVYGHIDRFTIHSNGIAPIAYLSLLR